MSVLLTRTKSPREHLAPAPIASEVITPRDAGPWLIVAAEVQEGTHLRRCAYWGWRPDGWYARKVHTGPSGAEAETLSGPYDCGPDAYWEAKLWVIRPVGE